MIYSVSCFSLGGLEFCLGGAKPTEAPRGDRTGLSPCYGLLTALVLLNNVARWCNTIQFFTKVVPFYILLCIGVGRNFPGGVLSKFFKAFFYGGAKSGEICFLPLEIRKTEFLAKIFKFLPLF